MAVRAVITGLAGTALSPAEHAFVREHEPWGFIIFKRNVETPSQLHRLIGAVREAAGRNVPVLVDQEGGRVQRLGPPHWPPYPPGAAYGRLYDRDTADGIRAIIRNSAMIPPETAAGTTVPARGALPGSTPVRISTPKMTSAAR